MTRIKKKRSPTYIGITLRKGFRTNRGESPSFSRVTYVEVGEMRQSYGMGSVGNLFLLTAEFGDGGINGE